MRILIVADVYPPEISSAAGLMKELAEGFQANGHQVAVATCYPRHYLEKTQQSAFPPITDEDGIRVIRIKTPPHHKVHFLIRGISQLLLPLFFFRTIKKNITEKLDAVIVYSPPLPLALVGNAIKRRYGAKFILNIQDIFPQNAIDLRILRNKLLISFFEKIESWVYRSADFITFHSEGGRRFLIEKKGIPIEKIKLISNWVDLKPFEASKKRVSFREYYGLRNKFVFLFGGIFGPAQGLKYLLDVAEEVQDIPEIVFLLVGDGMEREKIEGIIKERGLGNVILKPFVSKEDYPFLVRDCDVGVVCLSSQNKTPFIPGKFLGYFAAGKPIVAFLNKESDGFELIKKAKCGFAGISENIVAGAELVKKLYFEKEKLSEFGRNGRKYAEENLSLDVCIQKFERLLL